MKSDEPSRMALMVAVFDYMEPPEAFSEEMREVVTKRTERLEKTQERWASRFEPAGMAAILRARGFCEIEDIRFQQMASRFGRDVQGLATGQAGFHVVHAKHEQAVIQPRSGERIQPRGVSPG